ncbi:hypothetical protein BEWA_050190 [Theileria equi strain WA]|uniref:Uncharacterized protein n=1 Tax=Theileria equi strain WA TaxID=1537102 RepID=L1LB45_THEEQ|nr:hypothetical protein BEWA_050190 [Theileria equi strain WA]EKX72551.1 hypothetical protein BEWA_050190 [Theileria equi strain WA]|eukprot:XP_004832003.1 hypothetical protein BEWA_050190 [Theileria equi strain WA]
MTGNSVDVDLNYHPGKTGQVSVISQGRRYSYKIASVTVTINVTEYLSDITTYKKLTYTSDKPKIQSIKNNSQDTNMPISDRSTFDVYYWIGDSDYKTPLIVKLEKDNCYEYDSRTSQWKKDVVASVNLGKGLDIQNCTWNKAHQLDISQTSGTYNCTSPACDKKFTIKPDETNKTTHQYIKYTFTPQTPENPSFLYFTDKYSEQTGFSYPRNVKYVNTYWKTSSPGPLIHYKSQEKNIWYKKATDANKWEEISGFGIDELSEDNAVVIKRLIYDNYLPTIKIDVSQTNTPQPTYTDRSSNETINVTKPGDDLKDYDQFTHKPKDNIYFKLGEVKHGDNTTLQGIETQGVFASVTAYYWNSDKNHKTPLLIELVTAENTSKYTYYNKKTKNSKEWTKLFRSDGRTTEIGDNDLKPILDELKNVQFHESSNTGVLAGTSVGTGLGGAGLGALSVWKGPALIARLIARL